MSTTATIFAPSSHPVNPEPFYLVGPTASGKSAVALELAQRIGGEIVNADAFQLYRGLDICTAKPSPEDLARVPHHLYGIIPPSEPCDARQYSDLARPAIEMIQARQHKPIVVGGSGLYVKSLTHGLDDLPNDQNLRDKLSLFSPAERVAWLLSRDSSAASRVDLKNDRRVTRALEICLLTGRPLSETRETWRKEPQLLQGVRLEMDRRQLNSRIERRVHHMMEAGLIGEIQALPILAPTAEKAIGVWQVRAHLAGQTSVAETIAAIQSATRQYARRQEKWFKRETWLKPVLVAEGARAPEVVDAILAAMPTLLPRPTP